MPVPEGIISTSEVWVQPTEEVVEEAVEETEETEEEEK